MFDNVLVSSLFLRCVKHKEQNYYSHIVSLDSRVVPLNNTSASDIVKMKFSSMRQLANPYIKDLQ